MHEEAIQKARDDVAAPRQEPRIPLKGERIELVAGRQGVRRRGTVHHVDHLQILVKWDDGRSESLRRDSPVRFRIVDDDVAL